MSSFKLVEEENCVTIEEKSTIVPLHPAGKKSCNLALVDLLLLSFNYNQKCLIFSLTDFPCHEYNEIVDSLKSSLAETLSYFYPLAGRLATAEDKSIHIDCNDRGVEFVEASAPHVSVEEVLQDRVHPLVKNLFSMNGAIGAHGHELPLLIVQVTRLKDGLVLAPTANHTLVDGTSYWHFISAWADHCRGFKTISELPIHARNIAMDSHSTLPITSFSLSPTPYVPSTFSSSNLSERFFHFSKKTINHVKEEANSQSQCGVIISSFQALCAHIWQAITRARRLPEQEESVFMLQVDCRSRVKPPLPKAYWGNAIQLVGAKLTAEEILNSNPAAVLNAKLLEHQDAAVRSYTRQPFVFNSKSGKLDQRENRNICLIASSPRFPMFQLDFGWGRAVGVRSGSANKFDGKLNAYPGTHGEGYIDIEICLDPKVMWNLENDPHFLHSIFN